MKDTFKIPTEKAKEIGQKVKDGFGAVKDMTIKFKDKLSLN